MNSLIAEYKSTLKSKDTEEHVDLFFYRPIGFVWAKFFAFLGISPNVVTILSIFLGVGGGIMLYPANLSLNIIGILLIIWANSYDSADGQLARMTGQYSNLGRILDGIAGDLWFASIYLAIIFRCTGGGNGFGFPSWLVWTIVVCAAICHLYQAAVADYFRQLHLYVLKNSGGGEFDTVEKLVKQDEEDKKARKSILRRLVNKLYIAYTRVQWLGNHNLVKLLTVITHTPIDPSLREEFLNESRKLCKWENFLTFNWRSFFLFAAILADMPLIYPIAELTVFNIVVIYLKWKHNKMCRNLVSSFVYTARSF
ncbi:MAG: CDP-alcohol phosphatidyltransferase family protein [Paramuribaculum sp.]|nr:CDP-alcohol phosphatidyltransferase family protein [Paramuribaculum sp.]